MLDDLSLRVSSPARSAPSWAPAARANRRSPICCCVSTIPNRARFAWTGAIFAIFRLADLRRAVVLLDQSPYLFHATVRENIAYARPDASHRSNRGSGPRRGHPRSHPGASRRLRNHPRRTRPDSFRRRAPAHRDGPRPAGRPEVLVLDEPTSALDEANERAIAETLVRAAEGRTAILITHRASLARIAHQTVTL